MRDVLDETQAGTNRRSFIKKGIATAAGATVGGLLTELGLAETMRVE
jgi:TAT (twin-arginine translocation) pathway signal sequence